MIRRPSYRDPDGLAPYPVPREREGDQACAGKDISTFFLPVGHHGAASDEARDICRTCPFQHACLAYALDRPDLYGVWGATTKDERDHIRRRGRRTA